MFCQKELKKRSAWQTAFEHCVVKAMLALKPEGAGEWYYFGVGGIPQRS